MSRQTSIAIALLLAAGTATAVAQSVDFYASQDIPVANSGILNDHTYTHTSDDQYEGITELRTGGAPYQKMCYLVHKWAIPVDAVYDSWAFHLEAHHTLSEGGGADDFNFSWSPDDVSYYRMLTVTKTSDDDTYQVCRFYPPATETIYIQVSDTNPVGLLPKDTIYVDHMYIRNYADVIPPVIADVAAETVTGPAWVHMSPQVLGGTLAPRQQHAMAYDSAADNTILFGGGTADGFSLTDTWLYDYTTNTWTNAGPNVVGGTLYPRNAHAMAYDSAANRTIMFGGWAGGDDYLNDTWMYDYTSNTWTNADADVVDGPLEGRRYHAMVYDAVANKTIMVGRAAYSTLDTCETWVYDFDTNTWSNQTPTMQVVGGEFPRRGGHALAYDSTAGLAILFGGWTPDGTTSDTWAYNCAANTWYNMTPTMTVLGGTLTPRALPGMVYDPVGDQVVMFAGQPDSGGPLGDTWTYTYFDNTWRSVNPSVAGGTLFARVGHAMVYDSANGATILFGGWGGPYPHYLGDTWMFTHEPAGVITWSTDELSDSVVRYGAETPPATSVEKGTMGGSHSIVLRSLMAYPTCYYYEVQSTDIANNTTIDDNGETYYTFTIGGPNNAPDTPSNPSPEDGATGVGLDVNVSVYVSDPDGDEMDVSFYDESDVLIGTVYAVPSGTRANMLWEGLEPDTPYGWYAVAEDSEASTRSETWHFTTEAAPPENAMHVAAIDMWYTTQGSKYRVYTRVTVVDALEVGVEGATVNIETMLPDSATVNDTGSTGADGSVTLQYGLTRVEGTYMSTVTAVAKEGWTYDYSENEETSESLNVP